MGDAGRCRHRSLSKTPLRAKSGPLFFDCDGSCLAILVSTLRACSAGTASGCAGAGISGVGGCKFFRVPCLQCEPCVTKAGKQNLSKNRNSDTGLTGLGLRRKMANITPDPVSLTPALKDSVQISDFIELARQKPWGIQGTPADQEAC